MLISHVLIGLAMHITLALPAAIYTATPSVTPTTSTVDVIVDSQLRHEYMDVIMVYRKVKAAATPELNGINVHLRLIPTNEINAYASMDFPGQGEIVLTTGLVELMKRDKDFMAGIIAHEFAHLIKGDAGSGDRAVWCASSHRNSRVCERQADKVGQALMDKAGYDPCKMAGTFKILLDTFGSNLEDTEHPPLIERIDYTQCINGIPPLHVLEARWY